LTGSGAHGPLSISKTGSIVISLIVQEILDEMRVTFTTFAVM